MRIPTGRRVSWVPEACSGPAKPAAATDYDTLPPVEPEQRREVNRIESRKLVRTWHRGNLVGVAWALQQSRRPSRVHSLQPGPDKAIAGLSASAH